MATGGRASTIARRVSTVGSDLSGGIRRTFAFARQLGAGSQAERGLRRAMLVGAAAADELLLACFQQLHAPVDDNGFAATLSESRELVSYFERTGVLTTPHLWHVVPPPATLSERSRRAAHLSFAHATYPSPYAPSSAVPGAQRYAEHTRNEIVHAWLLRQDRPAPWVVCVHGAGMGDPVADIMAFRGVSLRAAGFNVAIPVLPHHGPRGAGRFTLAFPNDDPAGNLHGAAQAIADVRALLGYIAARDERVVLFGLSLGAYVAAAVAALEPALAGVVVGVPVVDIPDLLRTHAPARYERHPRFTELHEVASLLDPVTSPLGLSPPATPVRRIWAGRADRLVRPSQVERLAAHWDTPAISWYQGGHLGFFGAPAVRRCISDALVEAGVASRHNGRLVAVWRTPPSHEGEGSDRIARLG
ncbi:MAG TPA: alpha/beta fold hydrolase [Acidimicrobiales bacterium]|nr:alpha/beta fold hydrolase [Acidimicrobiales bacterium]